MKIELRHIEVNEQQSQVSTAFRAGLYINDVSCGPAYNSGLGGPTLYGSNTVQGRDLIRQAAAWCKSPQRHQDQRIMAAAPSVPEGYSLSEHIDQLLQQHLLKVDPDLFRRRLQQDMHHGIVADMPGQGYRVFHLKQPIADILEQLNGLAIIEEAISTVTRQLRPGESIINTNLSAGITKDLSQKTVQPKPRAKVPHNAKPPRR